MLLLLKLLQFASRVGFQKPIFSFFPHHCWTIWITNTHTYFLLSISPFLVTFFLPFMPHNCNGSGSTNNDHSNWWLKDGAERKCGKHWKTHKTTTLQNEMADVISLDKNMKKSSVFVVYAVLSFTVNQCWCWFFTRNKRHTVNFFCITHSSSNANYN